MQMKTLFCKSAVVVTGLLLLLASTGFAEEKKANLGVSIPAATHGWTGGVVYWANQAKKDLEKEHPGLKITVKTAGSPAEQANQLQDLLTATKIDSLVVLPFESASLTKPVAQLKNKGVYVTVVDRGLTDPAAQDAYVSGDNPGFAKISASIWPVSSMVRVTLWCFGAFLQRSIMSAWKVLSPS